MTCVRRSVDYDACLVNPLHRIICNYFPDLVPPTVELVISSVDVILERICIKNVSSGPVDLTGYTLHDQEDKHVFRFPNDFTLQPQTEVAIYCTPGKMEGGDNFTDPYLLWTNADGSLRRKEVLNNDEEVVTLYDSFDKLVCRVKLSGGAVVFRSVDVFAQQFQTLLLASLSLSYFRIVFLFACSYLWYIKHHISGVVGVYICAVIIDISVRLLQKCLRCEDKVVSHLLLLSDRLAAVVLYTILMQQSSASSSAWTYFWQLSLLLDMASHWFLHAARGDFAESTPVLTSPIPDFFSSLAGIGSDITSQNGSFSLGNGLMDTLLLGFLFLCFATKQFNCFISLISAISSMAMASIEKQKSQYAY